MGRKEALLLAASGMAVVMLTLAVCLVGSPSWSKNGPGTSAVLAVAHAARSEQVVPEGHQHQIDRTAPTAFFAEETDTKDEYPANSGLLTALLLWSFFGTIRWGTNSAFSASPGPKPSWSASCMFYSVVCLFQRRSPFTLSGVFRF